MEKNEYKQSIGPWETDSLADSFYFFDNKEKKKESPKIASPKLNFCLKLDPRKTCNYVDNVPGRNINIEKAQTKPPPQPTLKKCQSTRTLVVNRASKSNPRSRAVRVITEPDISQPVPNTKRDLSKGELTNRSERFNETEICSFQNTSRIFDFSAKENISRRNDKNYAASCKSQLENPLKMKLFRTSKSQEKRPTTTPERVSKGIIEKNKSFLEYVKNLYDMLKLEEEQEKNNKSQVSFDDRRRIHAKVSQQQKRVVDRTQIENCSKLMNTINQILAKPKMPIVPLVNENRTSPLLTRKKSPAPMKLNHFQNDKTLRPTNRHVLVSDLLNKSKADIKVISFTRLF